MAGFCLINTSLQMGIRGLHICIKKTIPKVIKTVDWQDWSGKRIGIDILCFIYKAIAAGTNPLEVIAAQIAFFKKNNIKIIYVFDGKPPSEKESVCDKRSNDRKNAILKCAELRSMLEMEQDSEKRDSIKSQIHVLEVQFPNISFQVKDEIKKFLYATGTMFICPNCEADTILAYWFRRGILDAIVSHDYDFIARGCRLLTPPKKLTNVIQNLWFPQGIMNDKEKEFCKKEQHQQEEWEDYDPVKIRKALYLCESRFVNLCVLMGSDYTPGLPIVPWKSALKSLQYNESIESIWARNTFSNWRQADPKNVLHAEMKIIQNAKQILTGENDRPELMMDTAQWEKWNISVETPEPESLAFFKKLYPEWESTWWQVFTESF